MRAHLLVLLVTVLPFAPVGRAMAGEPTSERPYAVLSDVAYQEGETAYQRERFTLDLYLPAEPRPFPVMLWFHGGSLRRGDKAAESAVRVGTRFASEGIGVASVNYRLSPRVTYPAYLEDAAAALAWIHANVAKQGGDPKRIFVGGHSAGAYLAAMLALNPRFLERHGLSTSQVAGAIPISGQMNSHSTVRKERGFWQSAPLVDESAPIFHAAKDAPPILSICADDDVPMRAEINRSFIDAMKAAGHRRSRLLVVAGRNHGSILGHMDAPDDEVATAMLEFIRGTRTESH